MGQTTASRGWFVPEHRARRLLSSASRWERRGGWLGVRIGHVQRYRLARTWGLFIHPKASVGEVRFPHPSSIVIGANSVIEDHVAIYQQVTIGSKDANRRQYPIIRRGASIFAGSIVIGAVEIGEDAVVGANSVVVDDVPAGATVVGNPARVIAASPDETPGR